MSPAVGALSLNHWTTREVAWLVSCLKPVGTKNPPCLLESLILTEAGEPLSFV